MFKRRFRYANSSLVVLYFLRKLLEQCVSRFVSRMQIFVSEFGAKNWFSDRGPFHGYHPSATWKNFKVAYLRHKASNVAINLPVGSTNKYYRMENCQISSPLQSWDIFFWSENYALPKICPKTHMLPAAILTEPYLLKKNDLTVCGLAIIVFGQQWTRKRWEAFAASFFSSR